MAQIGIEATARAETPSIKARAAELRIQSNSLREQVKRFEGILADAGISSMPTVEDSNTPEDSSLTGTLNAAQNVFSEELARLDRMIEQLSTSLV